VWGQFYGARIFRVLAVFRVFAVASARISAVNVITPLIESGLVALVPTAQQNPGSRRVVSISATIAMKDNHHYNAPLSQLGHGIQMKFTGTDNFCSYRACWLTPQLPTPVTDKGEPGTGKTQLAASGTRWTAFVSGASESTTRGDCMNTMPYHGCRTRNSAKKVHDIKTTTSSQESSGMRWIRKPPPCATR
jgi:hypothetical protein